jgi:hypothetical protein
MLPGGIKKGFFARAARAVCGKFSQEKSRLTDCKNNSTCLKEARNSCGVVGKASSCYCEAATSSKKLCVKHHE